MGDCEEGGECAGSVLDGFCNMEQCDWWCESVTFPYKECVSFLPRT
ncbi:hypothetical protein AGMMS49975_08030 [Clostridia bacterium]|nr:hypothetical protein AGMMS49975_08030 [Clostridia bacterium]